jgi:poly(3-hydroxybutyrate) depolymerase
MKYAFIKFGAAPASGHSLYISMHGGGGAPAAVNDRQWKNQIRLYKPVEGYYLAPRAATDTWNLWHQGHIDPMFDTLIENFVALKGVDPNKVYITGYSAGGDGTYQLGPRMADRWAAAAMMAGHPNEARPDNLYNLPFFIQCGGKDAAYDRNKIAAKW